MNYYLLISIFIVSLLFIVIRLFNFFKVGAFQAITFNYFTAAFCSFLFNYQINLQHIDRFPQCMIEGLPVGLLFIAIFYLMSVVTTTSGVAVTSVLSKMSVIIPIIAGVILYNEQLVALKIAGIFIALVAVVLTGIKNDNKKHQSNLKTNLLLLIFFIGSGLVDTSIKYLQATRMTLQTEHLYTIAIFGVAGIFGILKLLYDLIRNQREIVLKNVIAGIVLGTVNFFSLYFVIKALQFPGAKSSITFAIINIGVILMVALCGIILFKERFSKINYAGFFLALVSIVLLAI